MPKPLDVDCPSLAGEKVKEPKLSLAKKIVRLGVFGEVPTITRKHYDGPLIIEYRIMDGLTT